MDSGDISNMFQHATAKHIGTRIMDISQSTKQADGSTLLNVVGETRFTQERGNTICHFEGLVIKNLHTEILGGIPIIERNDLSVKPAKSEIWMDNTQMRYGSTTPSSNVKRL